jgi:PAS domain S-box-containing protein
LPEVAERRRKYAQQVIETKQPVQFEDERFGQTIDNRIHPVFDLDGNVNRLAIVGIDITERRQADEKLRRNEERLRNSLEAATDAIWDWNVTTSEMYFSPRWYEILGYQPYEIKPNSKEWVALAHPDDKDAALKTIYESIANGLPYEVEFRTQHANGQWIWCLVKGKVTEYDASGKPTRVSGTCSDITIRKQTEEALRESELKYRSLIENTSDVVFCVNEKGEYQFANQVFAATFGKTPDYFKGKNFWDIYPKEEADYRQATNIKVFETGVTQSIEVTVPLPDKTLYFIANANPIKNETGKVILNLTSAVDITERKKAEEKIRESETMLKNSQQLAKIGSFHYNAQTDQAYWSDELFVLYGLEPEKKMMSRSEARSFLHPDDVTLGDDMILKALETGDAVEVEYRIIRADGVVRNHFAITQITKDENNEMIAIDGTVQDITERKQAEEALRESEVQYRNLANSGMALIWTAGTDKLCNYFNEPWMRFTGRTLEQELGNGWTEGVHPEDLDRCVLTYSWAFDRRESFEMEYRLRHASGEYRWLRDMGTPNFDSHGDFIGYIGHCFDITERKHIEAELVRAKEKAETSEQFLKIKNEELVSRNTFIQTILENLPIGVALNEINRGEATYMNKKFQEIYGWSSDEITSVGSFFEKVYPDETYRKTLMEWIMSDIQSGDPTRMHWENITATHKDGSKRVINAVNIPLLEQNTMVSTVIDITALNNIQEDLIAAKEKAEESDRLKSAFLANMSHEIRTPMNSIMGFASLLPEEESIELMATYAKIIVRSSEQLVHIIDDIVLYSRLQTKLLSYTPTPFNVHNLLTDVKQSFCLPEFQKGVVLNIETTSDLPIWISSDYEKLCQVFTNLISNAFKYTFSGSITIGFEPLEKELRFFVRDTGLGIPPNEIEKIFDRFYRGSNVNKGVIGGTGLGLSIVKELMDLLGGKIWAESEENKGTTFFFTIPV